MRRARAQNFAAYGGIFASELLNLSARLGASELASPRFDDVFREVLPELGGKPAKVGESRRFDERGAAIVSAVRVLGNLLGSTITHEVAHSLGLTALDGRYHNEGDTPNWIMDAGQFRPFEERAEIDGFGPAVFEPYNREYLLGILPLGFMGTVADFKDLEAFRAVARRSRRFGFAGATCIHPSQLAILNEEYGVSPEQAEAARRLIAAYEGAKAKGLGAVTFEGKMIDVPVVERAKALLARARR